MSPFGRDFQRARGPGDGGRRAGVAFVAFLTGLALGAAPADDFHLDVDGGGGDQHLDGVGFDQDLVGH